MERKKKLIICIPTYDRSEEIDFFLKKELTFLHKYDVDIAIFDSSEDCKTKDVVTSNNENGFMQISYYKLDSSISSNEKVFIIYEKMREEYDYVWVTHDHTIFNEQAFDYIMHMLDKKADFYFLKTQCQDFNYYTTLDRCQFLYESAWLLGRMGAAIIKSQNFLDGVDWRAIYDKYLIPECWNFSHIGFYFERASQIDNFTPITLEFPREFFYDTHRLEKLSWEKEAIRICTECWGSVIMSLPDVYTNKAKVITTIDKYFLTEYKLLEYKKRKIYSLKTYFEYVYWMKKVFPKLWIKAFWISVFPYKIMLFFMSRKILKAITKAKKQDMKLCIYGAGKHAQECLRFGELLGIQFDAILVTGLEGNPEEIDCTKVHQAEEYISKNKTYVIIAVAGVGQHQIEKYLNQKMAEGYQLEFQTF